jgi:predicted PurR-regulated permease PerM
MTKRNNKSNFPILLTKDGELKCLSSNRSEYNSSDKNIKNYRALIDIIYKFELNFGESINKCRNNMDDLKQAFKDLKQSIKELKQLIRCLRKWFIGTGVLVILSFILSFIVTIFVLFMWQQYYFNKLFEIQFKNTNLKIEQFDDKLAAQFAAQNEANERLYQQALEALKKSTEPPTR